MFESARLQNDPEGIMWDEAIGKNVVINDNDVVSFLHPDGEDELELDLNLKRLRSMWQCRSSMSNCRRLY
jgi:hypothetical protein